MNTSNLKDTITNYLAILLVALGALNTFLQANAGQPINWQQLVLFVGGAVISYFVGKAPNGKAKTADQVASANAPTGNVIKTLALLIGLAFICNFSQAQNAKYFFKSNKSIETPRAKKSSLGDVTTTPANQWFLKLDGSLSLVSFQYDLNTKNVNVGGLDMAGLGISFQSISQVNGQNYADLTLKALVELPTPTALNKQIGGAIGVFIWDNHLGITGGYKYPGPFAGINASWNF
jgi:hypothetical protein